jgi:hypothetical protein
MKKTFLFTLVFILSLSVLLPASAAETDVKKDNGWRAKWTELKDKFKKGNGEKRQLHKKIGEKYSIDKDAKVGWGELVAIGTDSITVKVEGKKLPDGTIMPVKAENAEKHAEKKLANGTYIITVNDKTNYVRRYNGKSSLSEFAVGDKVYVVAKAEDDGYVALLVKDVSIFFPRKPMLAEVESVDATNNTVTVKKGEKVVTVNVNEDTKVKLDGEEVNLSDLESGDKIAVKGVVNKKSESVFAKALNAFRDKFAKARGWFGRNK